MVSAKKGKLYHLFRSSFFLSASFECFETFLFRYEIPEFQQRVMEVFGQLKDDSYWKEVDADKTQTELHNELLSHVDEAMENITDDKLQKIW